MQSERKGFVPCDHEYLNFRGDKSSKSRGAAVDVSYSLSKYDPDPLRCYPTTTAPETRDTEFAWEDFVERNNNELVLPWGNLANRMLSFAYKRLDGRVHANDAAGRQSHQDQLGPGASVAKGFGYRHTST